MKKVGISILLMGITLLLPGQDIASLQSKLTQPNVSTEEQIETLNLLSRELTYIDPIQALENANRALALSTETENQIGIGNAYRNLSNIYSNNESYFISMEYLQRAMDIFSSAGDSVGIANCFMSLGHTYRSLKNREEEVGYHKKSYEIFKRLGIAERIGVAAHNLGESYYYTGEFDKSRMLTHLAIKINDSINNQAVLSACYKVMGLLEKNDNKLDSAKASFEKVLTISDRLGSSSQKIATVESIIQLASIYKQQRDYNTQLEFLLRAADFSKEHNLPIHLQTSYNELIEYFLQRNSQNKVKEYMTAYSVIADSLNQKQLVDRSRLTSSLIEAHALSKAKGELETVNILQSHRIQNRNTILLVIGIATIILLGLIFILHDRSKKLEKQNEIIDAQKKNLEELNSTKDKFFSIVAHDLKSPLNSLSSFSSLLIHHYDKLSKEEILKMGAQLKKSVDNTIKMVDNLITWARIQMNDIEHVSNELNVKEIAENVFEVYRELAISKGINMHLHVDESITLVGDKDQIAFIIRNLVNNAIKFTGSGGSIAMKAKQLPNQVIEIAVSDSGVGIPPETLNQLFMISKKQSRAGTAGEQGTGIGLMLSYEFARLNNGTIEVDSAVGQGTTFYARFKSGGTSKEG